MDEEPPPDSQTSPPRTTSLRSYSPTSIVPSVALGPRSSRNSIGSSNSRNRMESPAGFERSSPRSSRRFEHARGQDGQSLVSAPQQDMHQNASRMSLYDFRNGTTRFRWSGMKGTHLVVPDTQPPVPLPFLGFLGQTQTTVMALKVTRNNGFEKEDRVAAKLLKYKNKDDVTRTRLEVQNLRSLSHNHIVAFVGTYASGRDLGLLMFPVAAWDLETFLKSPNVHDRERRNMIRPWFRCLARVTRYLHKLTSPFKHRDIKPANILIDQSGAVFLTDFGISKRYPNAAEMVTQGDTNYTLEWASPQRLRNINQGEESDIFSLGCVFLHMATVLLGYTLAELEDYLIEQSSLPTRSSGGHLNAARPVQTPARFRFGEEYEVAISWARKMKLEKSHSSDPNLESYQSHLAEHLIDVIVDMIQESSKSVSEMLNAVRLEKARSNSIPPGASGTNEGADAKDSSYSEPVMRLLPLIDLEQVATKFDKICEGRCKSCDEQLPTREMIPEAEYYNDQLPNAGPSRAQTSTRKYSTSSPHQPHFNEATTSSDSDVRDFGSNQLMSPESKNAAARSTDASGARASPKTAEQNESKLSTKPSISSSRKNDTSSSSPQLSEIGGGISQNYTSSRPDLTTQPPREKAVRLRPNVGPSPQKSDQQFIRPGHRLTGFSTSSVNSKIRLAYWEHKKIRVDSFDDIKKVPGTEILVFDNTPGAERYVVKKKAEMQAKLHEGILLRLPRSPGRRFRVPDGYVDLWTDVSKWISWKRMCGLSLKTMFIPGRFTSDALKEALAKKNGASTQDSDENENGKG